MLTASLGALRLARASPVERAGCAPLEPGAVDGGVGVVGALAHLALHPRGVVALCGALGLGLVLLPVRRLPLLTHLLGDGRVRLVAVVDVVLGLGDVLGLDVALLRLVLGRLHVLDPLRRRLGHLGLGEGLLPVGRLGVGLGLGTRHLALLPRLLGDRARMRVGVGVLAEDVP